MCIPCDARCSWLCVWMAFLVTFALGCFARGTRAPTITSPVSVEVDSARAVRNAIDLYKQVFRDIPDSADPRIERFSRDAQGVVILLAPADRNVLGGGLLVRVATSGVAEVIKVLP
jgi:hypothetical protein